MNLMVFLLLAYLLGSVSFAVVVSRLFGLPDPRTFGSKNPGATNVLRTGRKAAAVLTLAGDAAKGWLAVFLAQHFAGDYGVPDAGIAAVGVAAFLGHIFPVFFRFQGGKGVATALGILLAFNLWLGLVVLVTWLLAAFMWRVSSLSALIAAGFAPFYAATLLGLNAYTIAVGLLSVLLIWRHKANIRNLLSGAEGKIGRTERPQDMPPE